MRFRDRSDAGQQLAAALDGRVEGNAVVLALPRGGVPVAAEVARHLGLPLDVIVVRKLGGEMAEEMILHSQRVVPQVLTDTGFAFTHPDIESALEYASA